MNSNYQFYRLIHRRTRADRTFCTVQTYQQHHDGLEILIRNSNSLETEFEGREHRVQFLKVVQFLFYLGDLVSATCIVPVLTEIIVYPARGDMISLKQYTAGLLSRLLEHFAIYGRS